MDERQLGRLRTKETWSVEVGRSEVLMLLSGGIDSAACAHYYQANGYSVETLFVDYGQNARRIEYATAERVAKRMNLPFAKLQVAGLPRLTGNIRGRNAAFAALALMYFHPPHGIISLGIHAGTPYEDCSPAFVQSIQTVFDIYSDGRIHLDTPFILWSKGAVWDYGNKEGVPFELTYSCEAGSELPCGECPSCRDREVLGAR